MIRTLILFVFLLFSIATQAQTNLAFKGGLNLADVRNVQSTDDVPELVQTTNAFGFYAGTNIAFSVTEKLGWQTELLYSLKGTNQQMRGNSGKLREHYHYLSIPLALKYQIFPSLEFQLGIELSILLASDQYRSTIRILDQDRKLDIGALGGLCYSFSERFGIEARYVFGLLPLSNLTIFDQVAAPEVDYSWFNQVLQVGLIFKL